MSAVTNRDGEAIEEVVEAEALRCRLTAEEDWEAMEALIADDLVYIHSSGKIDDKAQHFVGLKQRQRYVTRDNLRVRRYGDFAIMHGDLSMDQPESNGLEARVDDFLVTQVWVQRDGRWQMVSYHSTRPRT